LAALHDALAKAVMGCAAGKTAVPGCDAVTSEVPWPAHTTNRSRALHKAATCVGDAELWRQHGCGQPERKQTN